MVSQDKPATPDQPAKMTAAQALVVKVAEQRKAGAIKTADVAEYDQDGFRLVQNKEWLLGRGFVLMDATFAPGEYGDEVTLTGVTHGGVPFKLRDGSTGIFKQLQNMGAALTLPVTFNRGLRCSEYERNGRPVKTYYLAED
jgi:hypothetical protein